MTKRRTRARAAPPPPCEPKPKRIRMDAEPFCDRASRYCADPLVGGTSRWDSRMLLLCGIVALLAWGGSKPKQPKQLPPGSPVVPNPAQTTLPWETQP